MRYILGIDTGGTYTDAVVWDAQAGAPAASAKRPTTHYDLGVGIRHAVSAVLEEVAGADVRVGDIGAVAVSTTLATNAVVEEAGARVGLFLIGFPKDVKLPVAETVKLDGGHTVLGKEEKPLDLEALMEGVLSMRPVVDAYAVSSFMSFVNPTHELVAKKAIELADPKPVFCSHQASDLAGIKERAATAVLHARLMPVMQTFLDGVESSLAEAGLDCPVSIIKGDCALMNTSEALEYAAATYASGPAATAHFGARSCSGGDVVGGDVVVVDVGGTTTDVTLVRDGKPVISKDGARIGDLETHISAVFMHTEGIGGDSHVRLGPSSDMMVGPRRVLPLCMAQGVPDPSEWMGREGRAKCVALFPGAEALGHEGDQAIVDWLAENGPTTPNALREALHLPFLVQDKSLEGLIRGQAVYEVGFTPTDALHVLGRLELGDVEAARSAATVMAAMTGEDVETFCRRVVRRAEDRIEDAILSHVLRVEKGHAMGGLVASRRNFHMLEVRMRLNVPIVGIGAAAQSLLPAVAERLGAPITFPDHYEVGNAIGSALLAAGDGEQ